MFQSLLKKIATALNSRNIPYMIIGGQAVLLYGEPRQTKDIDVTLGVGPERLGEFLDLARESSWRVLTASPETFVAETMVLPCQDTPTGIRLDFVFSFSEYEKGALARVRRILLDDIAVNFASPEDIVIHKIVAGRPRDLEDVKKILLKNPSMDMLYVQGWLELFEESLSESFVARLNSVRTGH